MSRNGLSRRQFLTLLPLSSLLGPLGRAWAAGESRRADYTVEVGVLYNVLSFHLTGTIDESVDRVAGRYQVKIVGEGVGIGNRIESTGLLRAGRWAPLRTASRFNLKGRESRSDVTYDYGRGTIEYHFRGETFLLRRLRVVDDVVALPESGPVDDVISATLNFADGYWTPRPDGSFETSVVRRRRSDNEGPDDVDKLYQAELAPLILRVARDATTAKSTALFDLTRFSSWARQNEPARIVFGADRRPELITSSLILGTAVAIRITS